MNTQTDELKSYVKRQDTNECEEETFEKEEDDSCERGLRDGVCEMSQDCVPNKSMGSAKNFNNGYIYIYIYTYIHVCVCVCVCNSLCFCLNMEAPSLV